MRRRRHPIATPAQPPSTAGQNDNGTSILDRDHVTNGHVVYAQQQQQQQQHKKKTLSLGRVSKRAVMSSKRKVRGVVQVL